MRKAVALIRPDSKTLRFWKSTMTPEEYSQAIARYSVKMARFGLRISEFEKRVLRFNCEGGWN